MTFDISKVRHRKEKRYGRLMLVFGLAIWILIALGIYRDGLVKSLPIIAYFLALWILGVITRALMRAYMFGHYVMIGPQQFPHLYQMVQDGARAVGLKEAPRAFVYNSHGVTNAMAVRLIGRHRYIWLTSALIDVDNDDQLRFVIGHELGHHVAGHLDPLKNFLYGPAHIVPFLGAAYSRARELTCDRVGAWFADDSAASRSALQMLACGSAKLNAQMNADAFERQERLVPPLAGFFLLIFSGYPRLTQRVEAISSWRPSQMGRPSLHEPQFDRGRRVEPQFS